MKCRIILRAKCCLRLTPILFLLFSWMKAQIYPVMGFKFLRTGSFLYPTNQQQVRPLPAMGFKILRTGSSFEP